jgi:hypothetical protein
VKGVVGAHFEHREQMGDRDEVPRVIMGTRNIGENPTNVVRVRKSEKIRNINSDERGALQTKITRGKKYCEDLSFAREGFKNREPNFHEEKINKTISKSRKK